MAIQYYTPGVEFQISSISELKAAENSNYTWDGRTLTAWVDGDGRVYEISSDNEISVIFGELTADLSGKWELNKLPVFLSVVGNDQDPGGTAGTLSVAWSKMADYKPLAAPAGGSFVLANGQTNDDRYYGSDLSLVLNASEGFTPVRFTCLMGSKYNDDVTDKTGVKTYSGYSSVFASGVLSVIAEFRRGVLTFYSGKNV